VIDPARIRVAFGLRMIMPVFKGIAPVRHSHADNRHSLSIFPVLPGRIRAASEDAARIRGCGPQKSKPNIRVGGNVLVAGILLLIMMAAGPRHGGSLSDSDSEHDKELELILSM
jgi:hypothetical protein